MHIATGGFKLKKLIVFILIGAIFGFCLPPAGFCASIKDIIQNADTNPQAASTSTHKSATASTAAAPADYCLQLGTFMLESDANKQVIELKEKGFEPYIFQTVNSKNQTVFAVRIGDYKTYDDAAAALQKVENKVQVPVFVTHYNSLAPVSKSEAAQASSAPATTSPAASTSAPSQPQTSSQAIASKSVEQQLKDLQEEVQQLKDEAAVRKKLAATKEEAEKSKSASDILESAGREYTLTTEGNLRFSYGLSYNYSNYDAIRASTRVEQVANHTISNSFHVSYGLKDNFSIDTGIPFVYKYNNVGTVQSKSTTGIGDLTIGWQWQPLKTSATLPTIIVNGGFTIPSGRSPYEIQPGEDLSTGSGFYGTNLGVSVSRVTDPVVVFSSFSASYLLPLKDIGQVRTEGTLEKVDPGMGLGAAVGMGYSLSYRLYLTMSFSYSYSFDTKYYYLNAPMAKSGKSTTGSLHMGVGYKFSARQNLNFNLGIPLNTNNGFSVSFSTPIEFNL